MDSKTYYEIKRYKEQGTYPKRLKTFNIKRNFRRLCEKYTLEKGVLFFKQGKHNLRVLRKEERDKVLDSVHTSEHGGHLGVNKTWKKIRERFYWKTSFSDVRKYVERCDKCQRKGSLKKAKRPLHPIPVPEQAFRQIGMDIVGPLEETKNGNKYILTFTEYLTKWVDAKAVPNKNAETVLKCFEHFISNHGVPETLITDQGREFCNALNDALCKRMGIQHRIASPYHPQTGGLTERYNRTLCTMISSYVNEHNNDWDDKLDFALFAYRTAKHESTKMDPFTLVYGRMAVLPVELDLSVGKEKMSNEDALQHRMESFVSLSASRLQASEHVKRAQGRQKHYHDRKVSKTTFEKGEKVLLHNTRKDTRKGGKLTARWLGPYTIESVLPKGTFRLEGLRSIVNANRLKHYLHDIPCTDANASGNVEKITDPSPRPKPKNTMKQSVGKREHKKDLSSDSPSLDSDYSGTTCSYVWELDSHEADEGDNECMDVLAEAPKPILFAQVDRKWQKEKSSLFGIKVKNYTADTAVKYMDVSTRPKQTASMRGDGNCLFRAFSYVLFGVQSYHVLIRDYIVNFMKQNENIFKNVTSTPVHAYINESEIGKLGTWGTEIEILAMATKLNTNIYVYCKYGGGGKCAWLLYAPLGDHCNAVDRNIYIQNIHGHFEPVLSIHSTEERTFRKPPYIGIKHSLPHKYWKHVSSETLDAILVDNHHDENVCREHGHIRDIFVKSYMDVPYRIEGMEHIDDVDPNIFNLLCDFEDFAEKVIAKSKYG